MATRFIIIILAVASAAPNHELEYDEEEPASRFEFGYSIHNTASGDIKQQKEARDGDGTVKGSYSFIQPDGLQRIVEYTADKENGFNAVVRYEGTKKPAPVHEEQEEDDEYEANPFATVVYAAPGPKVDYAGAPANFATTSGQNSLTSIYH